MARSDPRLWIGVLVVAAAVAAVVALLAGSDGGGEVGPRATREPDGGRLWVDARSRGGRCSDERAATAVRKAAPLCSLARAVELAPPDATVVVRGGHYDDLAIAGRTGRPITIEAARGERPVVEGVNVVSSSDVTIAGLRITDLATFTASSGVEVRDNDVSPYGFVVSGGADLYFLHNAVHDLTIDVPPKGTPGLRCNTFSDGAGLAPHCGFGFRVNAASRVYIRDNRIEGIPADGVQLAGTTDVEVRGNRFERIHAFVDRAEHSDAVQLVGGNERTRIIDNVFVDARGILAHPWQDGGRRFPGVSSDLVVRDNLFARMSQWAVKLWDVDGAQVAYNTAWDAGTFGLMLADDPGHATRPHDVRLVGNILRNFNAGSGMVSRSRDNVIAAGPRYGPTDVTGRPVFRNPALLDYRLEPGSAFAGKGASVTVDPAALASLDGDA